MDKLYLGKITGSHGIKGELKLLSDFEKIELIKPGFSFYIDNEIYTLRTIRPHQNKYLITLNEWNNINEVLFLIGKDVYINRDELPLNNQYLMQDLIGYKIIFKKEIGIVKEIYINKKGYLLKVDNNHKLYYIPFNNHFILDVKKEKKQIIVQNVGGLWE